ncbi:STAS/SEC14 domain-containing protein [Mangrovicoccus sp. HB161399]|uniref:STAS/SEC14 domain-containing protein n=1 Tax=Mangrovicoccus sp. HB161399 TaxID=2720392 RepID=UPI001556C7B8|nr:STAS/SEC14 domain-containing protein [Mangrovicoccus sp. HB161399]
MITQLSDPADPVLDIGFTGTVTAEDYAAVLAPALERGRERIRMRATFGEGFRGYSSGAMIADARLGLRHWRDFARVAVVSDVPWLRWSVAAFAPLVPCEIKLFHLAERDSARDWLG